MAQPAPNARDERDYGYYPQQKLWIRVYDLNQLAGRTLEHAWLYVLSDVHEGDPYARLDAVEEFVDWVRNDPNGFLIIAGDTIDAANRYSVGDPLTQTMTPQQAKKQFARRLEPLKSRILCVVGGNHDRERATKTSGGDFAQDIADMLGVYYEPEIAVLRLKVGRYNSGGAVNYDVAVAHGAGGGRTIGGKFNMLARMAEIVVVDLYICGHTHQAGEFPRPIFVPVEHRETSRAGYEGTWIKADLIPRRCLMSGPFREWGGYAARNLVAPNVIGAPRAWLSGKKKWIKIED